jgi:hypothetical protein
MYERSYGYKYEQQKGLSTTDIAKLIRADIKRAIRDGMLPERWKYSVVSESFSGGSSINVRVKDCADAWTECEGIVPGSRRTFEDGSSVATGCPNMWCAARGDAREGATAHSILTDEAAVAKMTLERIHNAYNHDGSEVQVDYFDVNFYGHVAFQDPESARWEQRERERKAAKRAALDAATDTFRIKLYGRQGTNVHLAAQIDGATRLVCGALLRRSSLYEKTEGAITCSRCARRDDA